MRIKANQNFYKNVLVAVGGLFAIYASFAYFLGFDVNAKSLIVYALLLLSCILLLLVVYVTINTVNRNYIAFDEEKIVTIKRDKEKIMLYYYQILYTKYHNSIDILYGNIDFGYMEIVYKTDTKDKEAKRLCMYISKKAYRAVCAKYRLG